jgi:4-amino-4-deoxy-L-arabinose transferase-like glycosyltransferase
MFLRKAGIHFDASFELGSFYRCCTPAFRPVFFGHRLPVMILPYLGAFKTWLYYPLLQSLDVTPAVLRLPVLLVGVASVWLFFAILDRTVSRRAAIAGALLLATDASFVIATTYDFGPIAFLHCFLLAGVLLLLYFERTGASKYLATAFFVFGLALWHKALFIWMLDGLAVAAVCVFPRRVVAMLTPRRAVLATLSLCAGALPLIYFNAVTGGGTLRTGEVMSGEAPVSQKLLVLKKTLSGNVLFAWLTDETQPATAAKPRKFREVASVRLSRLAGGVRSNWLFYAFVVSCCLVPWLYFTPSRRAALFVLIYLVVTWAQMLILPNTGASIQHVLLLWPFPHFLIAIALTQIGTSMGRHGAQAAACALAAIVAANLMLINQYYSDLVTNGTSAIWTDAIYPLHKYLDSATASRIVTTDWGYATTLCLLSDGEMPLDDISYTLLGPSDGEVAWIRSLIEDPRNLFVDHTAPDEQFTAARRRLESIAAASGRSRELVAVIEDRNRRPRFEIFRYQTEH